MKTIKILSLGLLIMGTTLFTSCGKKGCTDASASNYDNKNKRDDGSCDFEGKVVFWFNEATSVSLRESEAVLDTISGSTDLTYYLDDEEIGKESTTLYEVSAPGCLEISGETGATKTVGSEKKKTYEYTVKGFRGYVYWRGSVTLEAYECKDVQLTWENRVLLQ